MLDVSTIKEFDSHDMCAIYNKWPQIAKESYELNHDQIDFKDIDHIVFAGMGGSGAVGDVLSSILSKTNIHVSNVRGYTLPPTIDSNTLVILTSVSGNTSEILSIMNSVSKIKCNLVAFTSGGKVQEFCSKNNIEHRILQKTHSPRASFPSFLFSMLKILESIIQVPRNDVVEAITNMEKIQKTISFLNLTKTNPSLNLAEWISGIPAIYYPWGLEAAAIRFKNSLQENAKLHAFAENVMEASHNGIVAWERKSNVQPIMIEGHDDHPKTKERWIILKEYFETNGIAYKTVLSDQGSILTKLISLIYTLDYSTLYLAIRNGIDPTPIRAIDFIKDRL